MALEGERLTLESDRPMPADLDARLIPCLAAIGVGALRATVVAPTASGGDERAKRWQAAQAHPFVRELIKRFEGDIISREAATREEWVRRLEDGA
jgi:hypothetical protein